MSRRRTYTEPELPIGPTDLALVLEDYPAPVEAILDVPQNEHLIYDE